MPDRHNRSTSARMDRLIENLSSREIGVRRGAVEAFRSLALNRANQEWIAVAGAIEPLVRLLGDDDIQIRRNAAEALLRLAVDADNQERIAAAGGIAPLICLLDDVNTQVRRNAAGALLRLAVNVSNQERIAAAGGIQPLVDLLGDANTWVIQNAAGTLSNLARDAANQERIAAAGGIAPLIRLLGNTNAQVRRKAAIALWNLAINDANKEKIATAGGLEPLVRLLGDANAWVRENAAGVLLNLAHNHAVNKQAMGALGAISRLIRLLTDESNGVRKCTSFALFVLVTRQAANAILVIQSGGIAALKGCRQDKDVLICRYVELALAILGGAYPMCADQVGELHLPLVLALLKDSAYQVRQCASYALGQLAQSEAYWEQLTALRVKGQLKSLLADDHLAVREEARQAIASLDQASVVLSPMVYYDESAFRDTGRHRLGGSSFCSGVFEKLSDHSLWMGKCNVLSSEQAAKADACREKIAGDIYGYFGIPIAQTSLARLPIIFPDYAKNATELGIAAGRTHTIYLLSEIIPDFQTFSAIPVLTRAEELSQMIPDQGDVPVIGLGHILAVASFLNDVDVIGGTGGNIGYQVVDGQARCFKIDPGESFDTRGDLSVNDREIRIATQAPNGVLRFSDFPQRVRTEFLETLALIIQTPDVMIERFFKRKGTESLATHGNGNFVAETQQLLKERKASLARIYQLELQGTLPKAPGYELARTRAVGEADILATLQTVPHRSQASANKGVPARPQHVPARAGSIAANTLVYDRTQRPLGSGGYADVYLGKWKGDNVAIKVLKRQDIGERELAELRREGGLMMGLNHPNIIRAYGVCLDPGHYSLVMHYYAGGTLYQLLRSEQVPTWPNRMQIALGLSHGLAYLHDHEVLHRDLKSLNILMEGETPVITDFGLAKIKTATAMTKTQGVGVGSIPWMAPEMFEPNSKYQLACDIYSLAMVFYEIASCQIPWQGTLMVQLIKIWVIEGRRPELPAGTPAKYASLMARCWQQQAADRPTADEVVDGLKAMQP